MQTRPDDATALSDRSELRAPDVPWLSDDALYWTLLHPSAQQTYDASGLAATAAHTADAQQPFYPYLHAPSAAVPITTEQTSKRPRTSASDDATTSQRAIASIIAAVPQGHVLRGIAKWRCGVANCFMMAALGDDPLDYTKKPFTFDRFAASVADPSKSCEAPVGSDGTITRTTGRSLHLRITVLPKLAGSPTHLETGFALMIMCRRNKNAWRPACLVAFKDKHARAGVARTRAWDVTFSANMEHCVDEASGRRIWGMRTSHVRRRDKDGLKAVRLEPRGPLGAGEAEQVCFYIVLCDALGSVLRHADGTLCIAQTNTVRYVPKDDNTGKAKGESGGNSGGSGKAREGSVMSDLEAQLARGLGKLQLSEQAGIAAWPQSLGKLRTALANKDRGQLDRVGVRAGAMLPPTAATLSTFQAEAEDGYDARIRAVSRSIGWHHADVDMTDANLEALSCSGIRSYAIWCDRVIERSVGEAHAWLREVGVGAELDVMRCYYRAASAGGMMQRPRFRATRTVGAGNLRPQHIVVDRDDEAKVHCLSDTADGVDVTIQDRMQALASLAYHLDVKQADIHAQLFAPYVEGFRSRGTVTVEDVAETGDGKPSPPPPTFASPYALYPVDGPVVDEEKFRLLLHVMRLNDFVCYTHLRDADRVRWLYARLLEEDKLFDESYYAAGRFVRFQA